MGIEISERKIYNIINGQGLSNRKRMAGRACRRVLR